MSTFREKRIFPSPGESQSLKGLIPAAPNSRWLENWKLTDTGTRAERLSLFDQNLLLKRLTKTATKLKRENNCFYVNAALIFWRTGRKLFFFLFFKNLEIIQLVRCLLSHLRTRSTVNTVENNFIGSWKIENKFNVICYLCDYLHLLHLLRFLVHIWHCLPCATQLQLWPQLSLLDRNDFCCIECSTISATINVAKWSLLKCAFCVHTVF